MPAEIALVRAEQTCPSHPAQWDAWDLDGRYWYLRYRGGLGTAGRDYDLDAVPLSFDTGDRWDGEIGLAEFCRRIGVAWAPELAGTVTEWEVPPDA